MSPELDLISCPESRDAGTTSSRPGARPTRWVGRASLLFYWLVTFILTQQGVALAAEKADPALVPSIFSPESAPAHAISHLAGFVLVITAAIFIVVAGLLVYAVVRFRRRANDDETEPAQVYGSGPVETAWTTVPFLIVVVLTLTTARVIQQVQDARKPAAALDVQVIGHQWWWEIRYPKLGIVTANELHVPVSQGRERLPTFLDLRSADVVHSFWVPRLAGKTDLIPNKVNSMWIEPERTGLFVGQCAKYCGTQHAKMLLRVYVDTREDFDRWVKEQKQLAENDPTAAAGRLVFERTACINCHAVNGTVGNGRFGPDLTHLMSRDTLGSGALTNSLEGLRAWIKSPEQFKPGVLMPAMNLNDADLDKLAAYLATLK
ncbi:MAG TPA: cytochrome c oxidase subunit II [Candidatus Dormibacteraeota bacterium]|nr:cytochrome c oxidase subunit II [Candidatus Dormibacteraeota bacterium]